MGGTIGTRRRIPREVVLAAVAAAVLLTGGLGWLMRPRARPVPPATPIPSMPPDIQVRLGKVRLQGVNGGTLEWEVEADSFDFAKTRPVLTFTGVKKVAILHGDKQELTLTAETLERNTLTGGITVDGNVRVTGDDLQVSAPVATWNPWREALQFPRAFSARFGDFTLDCPGNTVFDVKAGTLHCTGGVILATQGSTLRADAIRVTVADQGFEMGPRVVAAMPVADVQAWAVGYRLPQIPEIPAGIKERYRLYQAKQAGGPAPRVRNGRRL